MKHEHPLKARLLTSLSRPTSVIHILIGPRQVGKTTIFRQIEKFIGFPSIYAITDSPVPLDSAWTETQWRCAVAERTSNDALRKKGMTRKKFPLQNGPINLQ